MTDTTPERDPAPARPSSDGRWLTALVVVALVLLVPTVGLRLLIDRESAFCSDVGELPALRSSLDRDGTPGPAMVRYSEVLDRVADRAPDEDTAAAARTLAAHDRRVGRALSGSSSGTDVVSDVAALDGPEAASLDDATATLDRSIRERCG